MAIRIPIGADGSLALDAGALARLKSQAKSTPDAALGKAAGQFEALFVQMLLKQMRESLPQDGPLSSEATRNYTAMFDQQLAQQLSDHGLGLKKIIEKQLTRHLQAEHAGATDPGAIPAAAPSASSAAPAPGKPAAAGKASAPAPIAPAATSSTGGLLPAGVQAFIDKLRPHAEAAAKTMGVPAEYLLAQAGLETGWGRSVPRAKNGDTSHNLFGIKALGSWHGPVVAAGTSEWVDGRLTRIVDRFRSYASFTEAFQDFARLLQSPRYAKALAQAHDAKAYATGLQQAGYATDPAYGAKLARAIDMVRRHVSNTAAAPATLQLHAAAADKKATAG